MKNFITTLGVLDGVGIIVFCIISGIYVIPYTYVGAVALFLFAAYMALATLVSILPNNSSLKVSTTLMPLGSILTDVCMIVMLISLINTHDLAPTIAISGISMFSIDVIYCIVQKVSYHPNA